MDNNNENTKEKIINLIRKLSSKLHSAKITQKILSLVLASATVLTISSCTIMPTPDPNDNTVNNGQNNNGNNNQNNNQNNQIDWSEYSQLLEDLCKDEYYVNLLAQARNGNSALYETGEFDPHPYAFLENEGFDVKKIKNGSIEAHSLSYVLDEEPNNLYINTRVLQDNSYWVSYLLKYELTDEEMDDYHMLHDGHFTQAMFINSFISKTKDPVSAEKTKIKTNIFDSLVEFISNKKLVSSKNCNLIITNPNLKEHTFDTIVLPEHGLTKETMSYGGNISFITYFTDLRMDNEIITSYSLLSAIEQNQVDAETFIPEDFAMKYTYRFDIQYQYK